MIPQSNAWRHICFVEPPTPWFTHLDSADFAVKHANLRDKSGLAWLSADDSDRVDRAHDCAHNDGHPGPRRAQFSAFHKNGLMLEECFHTEWSCIGQRGRRHMAMIRVRRKSG